MSDEPEIKNAIVRSARLTRRDNGLLSAWLDLDYGGAGQGFGGYSLYLPKDFTHHRTQANYAGHFIWRILDVAGVDTWDDIAGKTIRVKARWSSIDAIGHIVKDDWFNPSEEFKALREEAHK